MTITKIKTCYAGEYDGQFGIVAETAEGRRFFHRHAFKSLANATRRAFDVVAAGSITEERWVESYPIYGSDAQQAEEAEAGEYAYALSRGHGSMADVPEYLQSYL